MIIIYRDQWQNIFLVLSTYPSRYYILLVHGYQVSKMRQKACMRSDMGTVWKRFQNNRPVELPCDHWAMWWWNQEKITCPCGWLRLYGETQMHMNRSTIEDINIKIIRLNGIWPFTQPLNVWAFLIYKDAWSLLRTCQNKQFRLACLTNASCLSAFGIEGR